MRTTVTMRTTIAIVVIVALLTMPAFGCVAQPNAHLLSNELEDYYRQTRDGQLPVWLFYDLFGMPTVKHPDMAPLPVGQFEIMRQMVLHDTGKVGTETSQMASEYLIETVITPLQEEWSVKLQDNKTGVLGPIYRPPEGDPEDLAMAKLTYYYVRDNVLFIHPEDKQGTMKSLMEIPVFGLLVGVLPEVSRFPVETVTSGYGTCFDKSMLLATLLELEGYDVALGYYSAMAVPIGSLMFYWPGFYHTYVLLRDPGWGIGHWEIEEDMFGNPMPGKWIVLDPINSPRHVPRMEMIGGGKVLEFGDDPVWVKYVERKVIYIPTADPLCYGLLSFEVEEMEEAP